jgi:FkbM family methyltransferase
MAWKESWRLKVRRRLRKPFNKVFCTRRYFISNYRNADFLLQPSGIGTLEISAKIAEAPELTNFMRRCTELRPDAFIDIGANIGLYSCILLKNAVVPRAVLFEPDRKNLVHLRANLLINNLLDSVELHEVALSETAGQMRLVPGAIDGGFSRIVADDELPGSGYHVNVARLDDFVSFVEQTLAIKIDVEGHECEVLAGMRRTLRRNKCIVQIESFETRDQVISMMAEVGYGLVLALYPNFVFEVCKSTSSPSISLSDTNSFDSEVPISPVAQADEKGQSVELTIESEKDEAAN